MIQRDSITIITVLVIQRDSITIITVAISDTVIIVIFNIRECQNEYFILIFANANVFF